MVVNLAESNSILQRFVAELRHVERQKDRMRFRRNLERVGEIMAYEISKTLDYEPARVETPLGEAIQMLHADRIVIATIMRAGLPFHQGFLNYFDQADNAFVAAYRKHRKSGAFEVQLDYVGAPDLNDCVLILADPMLATGASAGLSLRELRRFGMPKRVHVAAVVSSALGIESLRRHHPEARIWTAAIDEELTAKGYIVPGLGDAGDLAYGDK
ncbi:MAG: uracil phosphoribosyltransferase [Saprospiraceae bacterium]